MRLADCMCGGCGVSGIFTAMLDFRQVTVHRGGRAVLDGVSFRINARERVGIVGPNGAGKTTLFSLISGESEPDRGEIQCPRDIRSGYLRQQFRPEGMELSVLDYAENAVPEVQRIQHEIEAIEARMAASAGAISDADLRRLGELQSSFEHWGGYDLRRRAAAALCGLGFRAEDIHRPLHEFSGGWQMRAELTRAIVAEPDLLLLDEPTNYLDLPAVEWLQRYLRDYSGTLLLISHDRFLLKTLCTVTLEVSGGRVTRYEGAYDFYAQERERRFAQVEATLATQAKKREHVERFVERFRYQAAKAAMVQSRIKMLERMEEIEAAPPRAREVRWRVAAPPPCGAEVLRMEDAGITYDGARWVLRGMDLRIMRGDKIALVGYNGLGKTTLLRLIGGRLPLSEGTRKTGHHVEAGYQAQDFAEVLNSDNTVLETLKSVGSDLAERDLRSLLGGFLFSGEEADKPVRVLSGGEKMRLAFARLLVKPPNLLLLDEPTTHLDIASREALEEALREYEGTLVLVSHDIEFVRRVATTVIALTPPGITPYAGGYDYYREKCEAAGTSTSAPDPDAEKSQKGSAEDRKQLRRERAQQREVQRKMRAPFERQVREAEEKIQKLELEQTAILDQLQNPEPAFNFAAANRRLYEIGIEISKAMEVWELAGKELEALGG